MMDLTPEQKAAIAAGETLATTVATALNPAAGAALSAAAALINGVMAKGSAYTMDDFNAAVAADDAAAAEELAAEDRAAKKP
jgi:hypothetical protein